MFFDLFKFDGLSCYKYLEPLSQVIFIPCVNISFKVAKVKKMKRSITKSSFKLRHNIIQMYNNVMWA